MITERPLNAAELFDALGTSYEDAFGCPPLVEHALHELLRLLPAGARVLDIGSGTGKPVAHDLAAAGYRVTGLDVSATMIEIARRQVPAATFVHLDVREWTSPDRSWDAVCAFFPFLQMSRADTAGVLGKIARWLVPGGWFMLVTVPHDGEQEPAVFLGHALESTSFLPAALREQVEAVELEVVDVLQGEFQPRQPTAPAEPHLLIVARRPG